jgi:hypothetical protein
MWACWSSPLGRCPPADLWAACRLHPALALPVYHQAAQLVLVLPCQPPRCQWASALPSATEAKHTLCPAPAAGGHPAQHQQGGAHTAEVQSGQVLRRLHLGPGGRRAGVQLHHNVPNAAVQVRRDFPRSALSVWACATMCLCLSMMHAAGASWRRSAAQCCCVCFIAALARPPARALHHACCTMMMDGSALDMHGCAWLPA